MGRKTGETRDTSMNAELREERKAEGKIDGLQKTTEGDSQKAEGAADEPTKDANSIRQVIKLSPTSNDASGDNASSAQPSSSLDSTSIKGALELKREILQRIKDFDFQIKKNREEIENLSQRLDSVTKDLDDLVSLYEIVSEQMNPFVGLSSVTRKRIEALENYTIEIESVKQRLAELEGFAEKAGVKLKWKEQKKESKTEEWFNLPEEEVDRIIDESFEELSLEEVVDRVIENYLEELKSEK